VNYYSSNLNLQRERGGICRYFQSQYNHCDFELMSNLCTCFLSVSQCLISAFWWGENAIFGHSSTGLINSMILDILV